MRFIGGKSMLLEKISDVIAENAEGQKDVFCDLFSGTGVVARYFKPKYKIYTNDSLHFSYVLQKASVENNHIPRFSGLRREGIYDPVVYLQQCPMTPGEGAFRWVTLRNYSPWKLCTRRYLTCENAARIDFIRETIEAWWQGQHITEAEYYYLLAGLVEGIPSISNITGTYGAYLKSWESRALKPLEMACLPIVDNGRRNRSFHQDANDLIRQLSGDILYIDPPYNARQYIANYHLLETVSRGDQPILSGVTGVRAYEGEQSRFCCKGEVRDAFEDLIRQARFTDIVVSYSTEGLMTAQEIEHILKKCGISDSFRRYDIPHRKYKSKLQTDENRLSEYIFYIRKSGAFSACRPLLTLPQKPAQWVKSPLNYTGGKYKLLPQLLPLFPEKIGTFVDLFSGGCNVGVNVSAAQVICNDIHFPLIEMFRAFQKIGWKKVLEKIHGNIERFGLTKDNETAFLTFRAHYNKTRDPIDLYTLVCYSFNYQIRFNNAGDYNNPFGRNRSHFNSKIQAHLVSFIERTQEKPFSFIHCDFAKVPLESLKPQDFIYCDPPYLITTGSYNDGNRGFGDWREEEERRLYDYLDKANGMGLRFALSNVLEHKGKKHDMLCQWAKNRGYAILPLCKNYANASYNTERGTSREVLIVNYSANRGNCVSFR